MNEAAVPRRTVIGWIVSTLAAAPLAAGASISTSWRADAPLPQRVSWLFAGRVPARAQQVITQFAAGVYAAVFELRTEEGPTGMSSWSVQRWLCIASEVEPGKFAIQTSDSALYWSSSWNPNDVAELNVLDGGVVEVVEDLLRGTSTTRWRRSGRHWELEAMRSTGVSAHRYYDHEYDRESRELVVRSGDPVDRDDQLETKRYAVAEAFTLDDYGRRPMTGLA